MYSINLKIPKYTREAQTGLESSTSGKIFNVAIKHRTENDDTQVVGLGFFQTTKFP